MSLAPGLARLQLDGFAGRVERRRLADEGVALVLAQDGPALLRVDADLAVAPDLLQARLTRERLARIEHLQATELVPLGMAVRRVVVEADLGVEGVDLPVGREDQRVDLDQLRVTLDEAAVELLQDV